TVLRVSPEAAFRRVILACGTTAPVGSVTTPVNVAKIACDQAVKATNIVTATTSSTFPVCFSMIGHSLEAEPSIKTDSYAKFSSVFFRLKFAFEFQTAAILGRGQLGEQR